MGKTAKLRSGGTPLSTGQFLSQPSKIDDDAGGTTFTLTKILPDGTTETSTTSDVTDVAARTDAETNLLIHKVSSTSHKITLGPHDLVQQKSDESLLGSAAHGKRHLRPVEALTGITHDRPEIIAITPFQPLVNVAANQVSSALSLTAAGHWVDTQCKLQQLRMSSTVELVKSAKKSSAKLSKDMATGSSRVRGQLNALNDSATFLMNVTRTLQQLRGQLDLRDLSMKIDPQRFVAEHVESSQPLNTIAAVLDTASTPKFTSPVDALVKLGYPISNVAARFTSTKIWLELVLELKMILRFHSSEFLDVGAHARLHDQSPIKILRPSQHYFGFSDNIIEPPSLKTVKEAKAQDDGKLVKQLTKSFASLHTDVHFKSERTHIAALIGLLSKELRYSVGLSHPDVQRILAGKYGFELIWGSDTNNEQLFDHVIGHPGVTITDIPHAERLSLVGLAQKKIGAGAVVLPFESRYLEEIDDVYTPGSDYYVNRVLELNDGQFNTARLNDLADELSDTFDGFKQLSLGLDFLGMGHGIDTSSDTSSDMTSIVASPTKLCDYLAGELINPKTGHVTGKIAADPSVAIFEFAHRDEFVRSLLFFYIFTSIEDAANGADVQNSLEHATVGMGTLGLADLFGYETPTEVRKNYLTKSIMESIEARMKHFNPPAEPGTSDSWHSKKGFVSILQKPSHSVKTVMKIMLAVYGAFRKGHHGFKNSVTRFSGRSDMIIMMLTFELVCAMMAHVGGHKIVGLTIPTKGPHAGVLGFQVRYHGVSHQAAIDHITAKLKKERALVCELLAVTSARMTTLKSSIKAFLHFIESAKARSELAKITSVLGTGDELQALFSEQQIMLLASTVQDMIGLAQKQSADLDASSTTDEAEELSFLDEAASSPKTEAELLAAFSGADFATGSGYNKRIISVGVPHGFSEHLHKIVDLKNVKSSFRTRQSDFITVVLHKTDVQMTDVVFYPQRYTFELSRFVSRDSSRHFLLSANAGLGEAICAVPMRDMGTTGYTLTHANMNDVIAAGIDVAGNAGRFKTGPAGQAFADADHAFLTPHMKGSVLANHALSYFAEVYVHVLSGISLTDYHFPLIPSPPLTSTDIAKSVVQGRGKFVDAVFANRETLQAVTAAKKTPIFTSVLKPPSVHVGAHQAPQNAIAARDATAISPDQRSVLGHDLKTLADLSQIPTSISDPLALAHRLLVPKQFDRVFNIIVDPDEFIIDVDSTNATPIGKQTLAAMRESGDVIAVPMQESGTAASANRHPTSVNVAHAASAATQQTHPHAEKLKLRNRNRSAGDMAFERYFVTLEATFPN